MSTLRIALYVFAAYEAIEAVSELVSNNSANSPIADTLSALPSAGSVLAGKGSNVQTQGGIDAAAAFVAFVAAHWFVE